MSKPVLNLTAGAFHLLLEELTTGSAIKLWLLVHRH